MENPFSHNRAANVIGRVLDNIAEEDEAERNCDHTDSALCRMSFASVEYRIMMALWETDCLTDSALEIVGLSGRHGHPEKHFCHDEHCDHRHHNHDCHDEHCHHHHRPSV